MEEIAQGGRDMSKFKVGDRVTISPSSEYYGEDSFSNPKDFVGTVVGIKSFSACHPIDVQWAEKEFNVYRESDLELIKEKEVPDTEKKYKITTELSLQEVVNLKRAIVYATGFGGLRNELHTIYREAQRKVVKVGEREYYEDELSAALANIKPIK
jgi:hypothetical protein